VLVTCEVSTVMLEEPNYDTVKFDSTGVPEITAFLQSQFKFRLLS